MKCLAAFYLMRRRGLIFNRNEFVLQEIRYIPLEGEYRDFMSAWKAAFDLADSVMGQVRDFHHIEKIEIYTRESFENYPYVSGKMKGEAVCNYCQPVQV